MQATEVLNHIRKRPFVPFRFRLSDGSTFDVTNTGMAVISQDVVYTGRETEPGSGVADELVILGLRDIQDIEVIDPSQTTGH